MRSMIILFVVALLVAAVQAGCPYLEGADYSTTDRGFDPHQAAAFVDAIEDLDWESLKADIELALVDSQDFWPADFQDDDGVGHYGPFMIRQAWHCTGSYRVSDGRGGCDGARQRFEPELSWDDNTNLDKAKTLLLPLKQKYGVGLSWGDLIVLTGTVAIEMMGGPVLGFCGGRIDDVDGTWSKFLGPTSEQEEYFPCATNGECESPLGTTTVGLIYVDPHGSMGNYKPEDSVSEIRDTFGRMGMNDEETVALIGGGHAFGKTHGACPDGPGPSPAEQPNRPWPGKCGTGKGDDTYTSGFDAPWSETPTQWANNVFKELTHKTFILANSSGDGKQWVREDAPDNGQAMLTTDIALSKDPSYKNITALFASDMGALNTTFAKAWYKLVSRDMGPASRCLGPWVAEPQDFQYPLVNNHSGGAPEYDDVSSAITDLIDGDKDYAAWLVTLSYNAASTFRLSDYQGGANGGYLLANLDWELNAGLEEIVENLGDIYDKYSSDGLTYADLFVLVGGVALEFLEADSVSFCPGRLDGYKQQNGWEHLNENLGTFDEGNEFIREQMRLTGLNKRQYVALQGRPRSGNYMDLLGYSADFVYGDATVFSNSYFGFLANDTWTKFMVGNKTAYKNGDGSFMTVRDMELKWQPDLLTIVREFAGNEAQWKKEFLSAWSTVMNLDRFDGPLYNKCVSSSAADDASDGWSTGTTVAVTGSVTALAVGAAVYFLTKPAASVAVSGGSEPLIGNRLQDTP